MRPGSLRSSWLASTGDAPLSKRVTAMASAAAAALQQRRSGEHLRAAAGKYGIPLAGEMAQRMSEYFEARRNAVLTYNK